MLRRHSVIGVFSFLESHDRVAVVVANASKFNKPRLGQQSAGRREEVAAVAEHAAAAPRWMERTLSSLRRSGKRFLSAAAAEAAASQAPPVPRPVDQQVSSLVSALKECGSTKNLHKGRAIHAQAAEARQLGIHVSNALVDMYAKCGAMEESRIAFDSIVRPNAMSWNVLIMGYVSNGHSDVALDLFERMLARRSGCKPNGRSFMAAAMACGSLATNEDAVLVDGKLVKEASLETGRGIHSRSKLAGFGDDVFLSSSLIDMFAKCGSMEDARSVLEEMPRRDVVSWNALLLGFVENGESELAMEFFEKMDCQPNARTFVAAAKACSNLAAKEEAVLEDEKAVKVVSLDKATALRDRAVERHCCGDIFVGSSMVDMFAKCGSMAAARVVFESMPRRDVVLWTSLVQGFVDNGDSDLALEFFEDMKRSGCCPNSRTYVAALSACASSAIREEAEEVDGMFVKRKSLETGVAIHAEAAKNRCCEDVFVGNTLIDMYSKCGKPEEARKLFDCMVERDVVSWNAMIQGYVGSGRSEQALELFFEMVPQHDPDERTLVAVLMACVNLAASEEPVPGENGRLLRIGALKQGSKVHSLAGKLGCCEDRFIASSLVDMYAKCGATGEARQVFNRMPCRDVVAWTSLIQGYVENGESDLALELFASMDCAPNSRTFTAALAACGNTAANEAGRRIHTQIYRLGLEDDKVVGTCLVNFHAKCGRMTVAEHLFGSLTEWDVVAWNALIAGFSQQGDMSRVLEVFYEMEGGGVRPDAITFVSVITACSHAGLVERGRELFQAMSSGFGIACGIQHYGSLVDLFGRANRLEEAVSVLESMPLKADSVVWRSLLAACCKWKNVKVGRVAFEALTKIDEKDPAAYVLMASIYRSTGLYDEMNNLKMQQHGSSLANDKP